MTNEEVQVSEEVLLTGGEGVGGNTQKSTSKVGEGEKTPADTLHENMASIDREIQGLSDPESNEEPDPRAILPGIASAIEGLAQLRHRDCVMRIEFITVPDWTISVRADIYGELQTTLDEDDPEADTNLEPEHLGQIEIKGTTTGSLGYAAEALQKNVRVYIEGEISTRRMGILDLRGALLRMSGDHSDASLTAMWPMSDPEEAEDTVSENDRPITGITPEMAEDP